MKNALLTLVFLIGGFLLLPVSQAEEWPYRSPGFNQIDEDDNEYGEPPEGEPMSEGYEEDDPYNDDDYEDDDPNQDNDFESEDNSSWIDPDDE